MSSNINKRRLSNSCRCCDPAVTFSLSRRGFLGAVVAGTFSLGSHTSAAAQTPTEKNIIDVHHHIQPPSWIEAHKNLNIPIPIDPAWSPQRSLEEMDKNGIAMSVVSITAPQAALLPKAEAARVSRESNEYAGKMAADHP